MSATCDCCDDAPATVTCATCGARLCRECSFFSNQTRVTVCLLRWDGNDGQDCLQEAFELHQMLRDLSRVGMTPS